MSGSAGDMGNLLRQAQAMQRELDKARTELAETVVEGGAGGVRVELDGEGQLRRLSIPDEVFSSGDKSAVEDAVVAAVRDGFERAAKKRAERMAQVTGGLNLPGLF